MSCRVINLWLLCLSSTTAGTAARFSATPAPTTSCHSPPRPNRCECATHATHSCFSAAPPLPPKLEGGQGLPHYREYTHVLQPQTRHCFNRADTAIATCCYCHNVQQLKSKMADHWFQVLKTFTFSSVLCLSQDTFLRLHDFLAAGQNQTFRMTEHSKLEVQIPLCSPYNASNQWRLLW